MNETMEHSAAVKNGVKRLALTGVAIVLEVLFILLVVLRFNEQAEWFAIGTRVVSTLLVLLIYNDLKTASMKMTWIILIMALPIFGATLYLLIGLNGHTFKMRHRYAEVDARLMPLLPDGDDALARMDARDRGAANIARYLKGSSSYPLYDDTQVTYYDDATKGIEAQKADLAKAERFIFMEYHAIEDAESWHAIQDILAERVAAGVEVRVFYDDMGSIGFINTDFVKRLEAVGIRGKVFNPFAPGLNLFLNNRDHRKITVIDGKVGFTGGYNLANEYFHRTEPYGFWKDTGIRLEGDAVQSLTVTFLEMWNAVSEYDKDDIDFVKYVAATDAERVMKRRKKLDAEKAERIEKDKEAGFEKVKEGVMRDEKFLAMPGAFAGSGLGFVQPYADSPMDDVHVGEDVYISMAESAQKYAWFITPYLIITDEMCHAFSLAARRGVDVRIITPGIPDKKIVYSVTRSYYNGLCRNGVRIFEYTPGFCHAKMSIADDLMATCGTINLDYRSLYHHFENGCLYADCDAVMETKKDFEETLAQCREVTEYYTYGRGAFLRFGQMLLRLAAPLM